VKWVNKLEVKGLGEEWVLHAQDGRRPTDSCCIGNVHIYAFISVEGERGLTNFA
jgi:hypothetical protein